jgi:ribonuclease HII
MWVCGVDEVGRGCGAGEVYAAAVILSVPLAVRDSKALSPARRAILNLEIQDKAVAWCVAKASLEEIEQLNILQATLLAMKRAVEGLSVIPTEALIDGNKTPKLNIPARAIVRGDAKVGVIGAASILAKVARDAAMDTYHLVYPEYGFQQNKGYLTPAHLQALKEHGPCPIHRRGFAPIKRLLDQYSLPEE